MPGGSMSRTIRFDDELRNKLMRGVNAMADAVRVTLGPGGRNVIMFQPPALHEGTGADPSDPPQPGAPAYLTNDGVSIARTIKLPDPYENMAAELLKEAAVKTNEEAGDGTTTAMVLTQAIVNEGVRNIAAGAHPLAIRRGIEKAAAAAVEALKEQAVQVAAKKEIAHVAAISCQDDATGEMIAEAFDRVGLEGVVNVDTLSKSGKTELIIREGIVFERGYLHEAMINNQEKRTAELYDPFILITDHSINSAAELIDILILAAQEDRSILIIADDIGPDAMGLILKNKIEGDMDIAAIKPPMYGEGRIWRLQDLAIQTGGRFVSKEAGDTLSDVTTDDFGTAGYVQVAKQQTVIIDAGGDPEAVQQRINELRYLVENTEYEFNRERHKERLAKFVAGVATIQAGGATDAAIKDEKLRIEDAINAARSAMEEGIVAGGGTAFIDAIPAAAAAAESLEGDERTGAKVLVSALEAPLHQIAENAGVKADFIVEEVKNREKGTGYDAAGHEYKEMIPAGIIDPVKVSRMALETAASIASTLLTAYAAIAESEPVRVNVK